MATIAIAPLPELGHILPTLELTKALRAAGHRVVYVGLADCRAIVEAEGFDFVTICDDVLPLDSLDALRARAGVQRRASLRRAFESMWRATAAQPLVAGREHARIAAIGADLALCDHDWDEPRLVFAALGVRVVTLAMNLWGGYAHARLRDQVGDREAPPMSSLDMPSSSGRRRSWRTWSAHAAAEVGAQILRELVLARVTGSVASWRAASRAHAALAAKYPRRPDARTLVLCPAELDFARRRPAPGVDYVGPCIDLSRRVTAPPLALALDDPRPLVYCAIGSQGHRLADARFVRATIAAAAARNWRLVVSIGDARAPSSFGPLPDGVVVRREVPQLAVLAHARAAIIHGGLGSVKECIWFGVPMLVLPGDYEQPGNAARVEHHGLGFARTRAAATVDLVGTLVTQLLDEPDRRARLATWAQTFRARQAEARHVAVIEAVLRSRAD